LAGFGLSVSQSEEPKSKPVDAAVLEMDQVTLVDLDVVRFLSACEAQGIELRRCSAYIRESIAREHERGT
jgi:hypothetical protein